MGTLVIGILYRVNNGFLLSVVGLAVLNEIGAETQSILANRSGILAVGSDVPVGGILAG